MSRGELEDARAEVLEPLEILFSVIEDLNDQVQASMVEHARRFLKKAIRPEAEFSAMTRDFLGPHTVGVEAG